VIEKSKSGIFIIAEIIRSIHPTGRRIVFACSKLVFSVFFFCASLSVHSSDWLSLPIEDWSDNLPHECTSWYHSIAGECPVKVYMHDFKVHISPSIYESGNEDTKKLIESFYSRLGVMIYEYGIPEEILESFREETAIYLAITSGNTDRFFPCNWQVTGCTGYGATEEDWSKEIVQVGINLRWENARRSVLLHEFAHVYHRNMIPDSFDNNCLKLAYEHVTQKLNLYQRNQTHYYVPSSEVIPIQDEPRFTTPYAGVNHIEWFAEISTRFWMGAGEYYPFDRYDLYEYDPLGYIAMFFVWQPDFLPQLAETTCRAEDF